MEDRTPRSSGETREEKRRGEKTGKDKFVGSISKAEAFIYGLNLDV